MSKLSLCYSVLFVEISILIELKNNSIFFIDRDAILRVKTTSYIYKHE